MPGTAAEQWEDIAPAPIQRNAASPAKSTAQQASESEWEDVAPKPPAATPPAPEQPGFFARASERLLGTQHPIDQAVSEGRQLAGNPVGTLGRAAKQAAMMPVNLADQLVRHPIDTAVELTGGKEFAEDVHNKNYAGAAGTLAGDVVPIVAPEAYEAAKGIPSAPGKIAEATQPARDAIGRNLRTPGRIDPETGIPSNGPLRPVAKMIPFTRGVADALIPAHPNPVGYTEQIPGKIADAVDPVAQAVKEGRAGRIPVRMPKPEAAPPPGPAGLPTSGFSATDAQEPAPRTPSASATSTGSVTSTGKTATLPTPPVPATRVGKIADVLHVPEPTHGDPRWVASTPRGRLPQMAAQGRAGAADQLQNIGKTVLYEPTGAGFSNVKERTTFGEEGPTTEQPPRVEPPKPPPSPTTPGKTAASLPRATEEPQPAVSQSSVPGKTAETKAPKAETKPAVSETKAPAGKTAEATKPAQKTAPVPLTDADKNAMKGEIKRLRNRARDFGNKASSARAWNKANEYALTQSQSEIAANEMEKALNEGRRVQVAKKGPGRAEQTATYRSAPPEIRTAVDDVVKQYRQLKDGYDKSHFERDWKISNKPGNSESGLPIEEKIARRMMEDARKGAEDPKSIVESLGLIYKGEGPIKGSGMVSFEHPDHPGETATLPADKITPELISKQMDWKISEFEKDRAARAAKKEKP